MTGRGVAEETLFSRSFKSRPRGKLFLWVVGSLRDPPCVLRVLLGIFSNPRLLHSSCSECTSIIMRGKECPSLNELMGTSFFSHCGAQV